MKRSLLLLLLLTACSTHAPQRKIEVSKTQPQLQSIPDATWEPIYFQTINRRAREANLSDLRSTILAKDDVELRMWSGFGLTELRGYVVKRLNGEWSALLLARSRSKKPISDQSKQIEPKSGWEKFWQRITDEGLFTLPDSSQLPDGAIDPDGISYVVEIRNGASYRTYMYQDPSYKKSPEAQHMSRIVGIFVEEFGV